MVKGDDEERCGKMTERATRTCDLANGPPCISHATDLFDNIVAKLEQWLSWSSDPAESKSGVTA